MVRGSGSGPPSGRPPTSGPVSRVNGAGRCGAVWAGGWSDRRGSMTRNWSWPPGAAGLGPHRWMPCSSSSRPDRTDQLGAVVSRDARRRGLVAGGLGPSPSLTIQTPFVARRVPGARRLESSRRPRCSSGSLAIVGRGPPLGRRGRPAGRRRWRACGRGTDRPRRSPVVRVLPSLPDEVVVATDVVASARAGRFPSWSSGRSVSRSSTRSAPLDGHPPGGSILGSSGPADGWVPTEYPLDRGGARCRSRPSLAGSTATSTSSCASTRRWSIADAAMTRSPTCAVITAGPGPGWIAALPRQRSLTASVAGTSSWRGSVPGRPLALSDARRGW